MDRDSRWDRTKLAYDAIVNACKTYTEPSAQQALKNSYAKEEFDEFVKPTLIDKKMKSYSGISNNDMVSFHEF